MSDPYAKHPCAKCEVFIKTRTNPNRALICETARALKNCPLMEKAEKWDDLPEKPSSELLKRMEDCRGVEKELLDISIKCAENASRLEAVKKLLNQKIGDAKYQSTPGIGIASIYPLKMTWNRHLEILEVLRAALGEEASP